MFRVLFFFIFNFLFSETIENDLNKDKLESDFKFSVKNGEFKSKIDGMEFIFNEKYFLENFSEIKKKFFKTSIPLKFKRYDQLDEKFLEDFFKTKEETDAGEFREKFDFNEELKELENLFLKKLLTLRYSFYTEMKKVDEKKYFLNGGKFLIHEFILNILKDFISKIES